MKPAMLKAVTVNSLANLVDECKVRAHMLYAHPMTDTGGETNGANTTKYELGTVQRNDKYELQSTQEMASEFVLASQKDREAGILPVGSGITVDGALLEELNTAINTPGTDLRKLTSIAESYAFVYLDISDFSKFKPGQQALVVNSVRWLASSVYSFCRPPHRFNPNMADTHRLCIGDGYIFVCTNPLDATWFGACLAKFIVAVVAKNLVPVEFHFRMGIHWGPVYHFWDEGRNNWNYIGNGINGGNRVLSVIGKDIDDVVFVSSAVRDWLIANDNFNAAYRSLLGNMTNRGRRKDKHDRNWRVFEIDYMASCPELTRLPIGRIEYSPSTMESAAAPLNEQVGIILIHL